jgi:signal peptidase I
MSSELEKQVEANIEADSKNTEVSQDALVTDVDTTAKKENGKTEVVDKKKKLQLNVYDFASIIMSAFIIIAVIFTFFFRLVGVKGQSMESTLHENDWLITMQRQEYVYGDIVVITEPNYFNEPLIKRVIATEGQTVDIDYASSTVYVDGVALEEPYINEAFILQNSDDVPFPYTVPEGKLFCMGDNRNHSTDSRSTLIGAVDERYILGKAVIRVLPFGSFDIYDYE